MGPLYKNSLKNLYIMRFFVLFIVCVCMLLSVATIYAFFYVIILLVSFNRDYLYYERTRNMNFFICFDLF